MDYSYQNAGLWNPIIQICIIAVILIIANILRRKLPVIKHSLMPTAVLAGFIILALKELNLLVIDEDFYAMLTYHCIAIGFIALSLRIPEKIVDDNSRTGLKSGAIIAGSYSIQAVTGFIISLVLALTIKPDLFHAAGALLPMGYGQGPGQANNIGLTYEALGFEGGRSFGLALAAMGYVVACVVGIIYINYLERSGKVSRQDIQELSGSVTVDTFQSENEIPIAESIDRVSIQVALVLVVYGATYLVTYLLSMGLSLVAPGAADTIDALLWGFNFMIGSGMAVLARLSMKGMKKLNLMNRQYQNNYLLSRISGLSFDIMIVAGIASIDIEQLKGLWLPFILMSIAGAVVTFYHLQYSCKKAYEGYFYQGFISMYGMMTGTISSGVLLLREIDPMLKTPAANNLVTGSSFAIALGAPLLAIAGIAPNSIMACVICTAVLAVYYVLLLMLIRSKPKKKSKN